MTNEEIEGATMSSKLISDNCPECGELIQYFVEVKSFLGIILDIDMTQEQITCQNCKTAYKVRPKIEC